MVDAVVVDLETGEIIDTVEPQAEATMTFEEIMSSLNEINALLGVMDDAEEENDSDEE